QGRQGLLLRVHYDAYGNATAEYTSNNAVTSPDLPSSGIPWMVPHSDYFDANELNPEWSFSGYTPENTHSLTDRPGWLRLSPRGKANTILKNDGEHNYSLITRLEFEAESENDEAGLQIIRGDATQYVKLYSSMNEDGHKVIIFSFDNNQYEVENTVGNTLWLKMIRINHSITGYYSSNGNDWIQVGENVNISSIDSYTDSNFQIWEGTQQGLYVQGKSADFDLYIYRDAYSPILAQPAANQYGTLRVVNSSAPAYLDSIDNHDWALYAGVEFGGKDYYKKPDSVEISAASATSGGVVEVWLDSLDTGQKVAECTIENTGGWNNFQSFTASVDSVSGMHDVYLRFLGTGRLFKIDWFKFIGKRYNPTSVNNDPNEKGIVRSFVLEQNYPNPFNPVTKICYSVPQKSDITIKVYNSAGKEVITLYEGVRQNGHYSTIFNGEGLSSGIYYYRIQSGSYSKTQKMILLN
ncbi:MAG: carbohydrate-binding protein, partial [bacterium]